MTVKRTKHFEKQYKKQSEKIRLQFAARLSIFLANPRDERLRLHELRAQYSGYWSIDVTGDVRTLFRWDGEEVVIFAFIGTHSQLCG
jgi:mRNA-degrading endonuclease YafQ of YafQ-DinJ toxin-antitoxin module